MNLIQESKEAPILLFSATFSLPSHGIKKNSKDILFNKATGRRFVASNAKAKKQENQLVNLLLLEKNKKQLSTIKDRVWLKLEFYFPKDKFFTKKSTISKKLPDLSNLYQMPEDALEKAKIIDNDTLIDSHDGSRRLMSASNEYILKIYIYKTPLKYTI